MLTVEQARHDVGLPSRYRATIRIGGRIALWEGFLPRWVGWMRDAASDVSIRSEIGFEEDLMRRLVEGTLDIGLMYTPSHAPGLVVEHLFDETLVLVSSRRDTRWPDEDYIYVEWGPGFYAKHRESYPDLERPAQVVNIGWLGVQLILANGGCCFLPIRMAQPFIDAAVCSRSCDGPEFTHPAYMVFPREADSEVLRLALHGLRELAQRDQRAGCRLSHVRCDNCPASPAGCLQHDRSLARGSSPGAGFDFRRAATGFSPRQPVHARLNQDAGIGSQEQGKCHAPAQSCQDNPCTVVCGIDHG